MQTSDPNIQARIDAAARLLESLRVHGSPEPEPVETPLARVVETVGRRPAWVAPRPAPRVEPPEWPVYCCAILRDAAGNYMLERRPETAQDAPGKLACFGGKRERLEHPDRCLRRELKEELRWRVGALRLEVAVKLVGRGTGRPIAWFYRATSPPTPHSPRAKRRFRPPAGSEIVWIGPEDLAGADLSDWHRTALDAERRGDATVEVDA